MIATPVATSFHSHVGRSCCRCRKDLTDAASIEAGVGPVCRKQDNHVLANSIPADPVVALHIFSRIDMLNIDAAVMPLFLEVQQELKTNPAGTDWRATIKKIEKILSFDSIRKKTLLWFSNVARALGYIGLAALWNNEASTGKTVVVFDAHNVAGPHVFIVGPQNKVARGKMRQLNAVCAPVSATLGAPKGRFWGVRPHHFDSLVQIVQTHYPMASGLSAARDAVTLYLQHHGQPQAVPITPVAAVTMPLPPAPALGGPVSSCRIEVSHKTKNITLTTPYHAGFIAELKSTVPYTHRNWDPVAKKWNVDEQYLKRVQDLIMFHYKVQPSIIDVDAVGADIATVSAHIAKNIAAQAVAQAATSAASNAKAAAIAQASAKSAPNLQQIPRTRYTQPKVRVDELPDALPSKPVVLPF